MRVCFCVCVCVCMCLCVCMCVCMCCQDVPDSVGVESAVGIVLELFVFLAYDATIDKIEIV